jgi:protein required for attachment to host cells
VPKHRNVLVVVADGEHVRFVRPAYDSALHTDRAFDSISAHKRSAELGSDQPGASCHTGSSAHHAKTPRRDPHVLEKQKFAHLVADRLNAGAADGGFDGLVIVAPAHILAAIRNKLDAATNTCVVGTLNKDLVKTPDDELWPHLSTWLRPVHRAQG